MIIKITNKILFIVLLGITTLQGYSQGTWTAVTSSPVTLAGGAFTLIGDTAYFTHGFTGNFLQTDIYKYSVSGNSWTANATGTANVRQEPYFLTNGGKGYIGGGFGAGSILATHEEVSAPTITFSSLASLPGVFGLRAFNFVLGGKNYVGGGISSLATFFGTKVFYEYDPSSNAWTQKADFPDSAEYGASFAVGGNGYVVSPVVTRGGSRFRSRDVQSYDPGTNTWTKKKDFPGTQKFGAKGFFVNKGMVVGGNPPTGGTTRDVWTYDHGTDLWFRMADYPGTGDFSQMGFVKDGELYFGLGTFFSSFSSTQSNFYKYEQTDTIWEWSGAVSSDWFDAGNWVQGVVPGATKSVKIPAVTGGAKMPVLDSADHVYVNNIGIVAGAKITLNDYSSITCKNAFVNQGNVEIDHFGAVVMSVDGTHIGSTGKWDMKKRGQTSNLKYNFWSSPFPNFSTSNLGSTPGDIYKLPECSDDVSDWENAPNDTMLVGKGYISTGGGNVLFTLTGAPRNGTLTAPSRPNTNTGTYCLYGNPYISALSAKDLRAFNAGIMNGSTFYFWAQTVDGDISNMAAGDYATYNTATSTGVAGSGSNTGSEVPNGFIGTGQAFMVENGSVAGLFAFTNDMRITENTQFLKKENPTVRINIGNNKDLFNQIGVVLFDGATVGFDEEFDAKKLKGNKQFAMYAIADNKHLAISALGLNDLNTEVTLGIQTNQAGSFRFWLNDMLEWEGMELWLEDKSTGKWTNLLTNSYWVHFDKPQTIENRFALHFRKSAKAADAENADVAKVWFNGGYLNIQSLVKDFELKSAQLMDATGKTVAIGSLSGGSANWNAKHPELTQGIYIVSLETNVGQKSYKLLYTGN